MSLLAASNLTLFRFTLSHLPNRKKPLAETEGSLLEGMVSDADAMPMGFDGGPPRSFYEEIGVVPAAAATEADIEEIDLEEIDTREEEAEDETNPATDSERRFKTFGFFDRLKVRVEAERKPGQTDHSDRYQRTLFGWGNRQAVLDLLARAQESKGTPGKSGYLAVCLIKLTKFTGHTNYKQFAEDLLSRVDQRVAYLVCLDAADVIVLRTFGDAGDPVQKHPLAELLKWSEALRQEDPLKGNIERLLTMVACDSLPYFIETLAERDDEGSNAGALVRITDMHEGKALPDLLHHIYQAERDPKRRAELTKRLRTTVGYYDIQAEISVPQAAKILEKATELVKENLLTTSTCFTSPSPQAVKAEPPLKRPQDSAFLNQLRTLHKDFAIVCRKMRAARCLNPQVEELVAETVGRFERLHGAGLIPGSRLLIWTAHDAVSSLHAECFSYLEQRKMLNDEASSQQDDLIHQRQRDYAEFLRAICDELDHRIALSLSAYTRFFPCSIEVPLKMVGALDMASRLIAASFRSYHCRAHRSLLQVFIAKAVKPSEFFPLVPRRVEGKNEAPYPTLVLTMFSPQLVRRFYYALFLVFYEVAQCIIAELIDWPSFTSLVFSHAFAERIAVNSTLAQRGTPTGHLPESMREWALKFLREEIADGHVWKRTPTRVLPSHFLSDHKLPEQPLKDGWEDQDVWNSDARIWQVKPVEPTEPDAATRAHLLCRDATLLAHGTRNLGLSSFYEIWLRRLHLELRPGIAEEPVDSEGRSALDRCAANLHYMDELGVNNWDEYLELASLIPFLRLFEVDADGKQLRWVLAGLLRDHWEVWRDTEEPAAIYDASRRYVVALAAMDIFRRHLQGEGLEQDCCSAEANADIMAAVKQAAAHLITDLAGTATIAPRAQSICDAVWQLLAQTGQLVSDSRAKDATEPLIVQSMVRFLVRLLHVFRSDGPNVIKVEKEYLEEFNQKGREMFMARKEPGNETLPIDPVLYLWQLQYRLSEENANIGHRFSLKEVRDAVKSSP